MNKSLVPWGTQEEEPGREDACNFSAWQKGISSPGKNDKREGNQKVGLEKWNLEPPRRKEQKPAF